MCVFNIFHRDLLDLRSKNLTRFSPVPHASIYRRVENWNLLLACYFTPISTNRMKFTSYLVGSLAAGLIKRCSSLFTTIWKENFFYSLIPFIKGNFRHNPFLCLPIGIGIPSHVGQKKHTFWIYIPGGRSKSTETLPVVQYLEVPGEHIRRRCSDSVRRRCRSRSHSVNIRVPQQCATKSFPPRDENLSCASNRAKPRKASSIHQGDTF